MAKIIAYRENEEGETFDLELEHQDHQYYLANGVLTSNSHAVSYSVLSYQCAWLMNYYTVEWMAAFLQMEEEKN